MATRQGSAGITRVLALVLVGLGAILIAAACGSRDEKEESAATTAATGTAAAAATFKIGGAGITSNPRDIGGLFKIDDGIAMFRTRPAGENRTGVSKDSIKLGRHVALTGPGATLGPATAAMHAIIDKVNAAGGVHGRKIELTDRDDQFNPSIASQVTQELVERDQVFAMFANLGTAQVTAEFDYLNAKGVPHLFAYSGAVKFTEPTRPLFYPSTGAYILETRAMTNLIFKEHPDAKLAIIYQNDDFGRDNLSGLRAGAKAHGADLVAALSYDIGTPDLSSHIQQVVKSGATAVYLASYTNDGAKLVKGLRENAGSEMPIYLSLVSTNANVAAAAGQQNYDGATGQITTLDVSIDSDKPVIQAAKKLADEAKQQFITSFLGGIQATEYLVRSLELAGPDLTREGLILAMDHGFDGSFTCAVCLAPSILGPQDHWPGEAYQPVRWSAAQKNFVKVGPVLSVETSKGLGVRGNIPGYECTDKSPCPWKKQ